MIVIQRNRILVNNIDEDNIAKFIKLNTVTAKKFTFGYEDLWVALHEVQYKDEHFLCLPRNFPPAIIKKYIEDDTVVQDKTYISYKKVNFKNEFEPRNADQIDILNFLHGKDKYSDIVDKPRRALFADTGVGKTFCTLKYIADSRFMSCIFCPDDKSIQTWLDEIAKFTDIELSEVCIIKGSESINRAIKKKDNYKLVLISNKTINSLLESKRYDVIESLFTEFKIGLKVFDEVHLHLRTFFFVEMMINTYRTFYITATDNRRIFAEDRVLHNLIPDDSCVYRQEERKRFDFISVEYFSNPVDPTHVKGIQKPNGFDGLMYLKYILNSENHYRDFYIDKVIVPSIKLALKIRSNPKHRIAILFKTKEAGNDMQSIIAERFPNLTIGMFNSDITNIQERMKETERDIIISTDKSFAGIINIIGLEIIINSLPVTSPAHAKQIIGRLRDEDNKKQVFIQLADKSFTKSKNMLYRQKKLLEPKCTSMRVIQVNSPTYDEIREEE